MRGSPSFGLTAKFFSNDLNAIEIIAHRRNQVSYRLTGLYERHWETGRSTHFYLGGGATLNYLNRTNGQEDGYGFEINAIIGWEYVADLVPISLGIDYKPGYNIYTSNFDRNFWDEIALNVRLVF